MVENLLTTNHLSKKYNSHFVVDNVNIHVKKGSIYGLVGRNGAGKTTCMRMLSGLASPSSGSITFFGKTSPNIQKYFSRIGVLIESPGLYGEMSALDNMRLKQIAVGLKGKNHIPAILELVGLEHTKNKKTKNFSLGMKQRLGIAIALIGEPDLLILDEPINGLDPQGIAELRETLVKLTEKKNITIIISSHILEELAKMATTYGFIDKGKLIQEISHDELMEKTKEYTQLQLEDTSAAAVVIEEMGITDYIVKDATTIQIYEKQISSKKIAAQLAQANVLVDSISISHQSLENYFLNLTGGITHA